MALTQPGDSAFNPNCDRIAEESHGDSDQQGDESYVIVPGNFDKCKIRSREEKVGLASLIRLQRHLETGIVAVPQQAGFDFDQMEGFAWEAEGQAVSIQADTVRLHGRHNFCGRGVIVARSNVGSNKRRHPAGEIGCRRLRRRKCNRSRRVITIHKFSNQHVSSNITAGSIGGNKEAQVLIRDQVKAGAEEGSITAVPEQALTIQAFLHKSIGHAGQAGIRAEELTVHLLRGFL